MIATTRNHRPIEPHAQSPCQPPRPDRTFVPCAAASLQFHSSSARLTHSMITIRDGSPFPAEYRVLGLGRDVADPPARSRCRRSDGRIIECALCADPDEQMPDSGRGRKPS